MNLFLPAVALVVASVFLFFALRRHVAGLISLRSGLRGVARGNLDLPLVLDLPRGLRSAGNDLASVASRIAELERAATQERFGSAAILGSIAEGVFIADSKMRIRQGNAGLEKMFLLGSQPVGRTVMETFGHATIHRLVQESLRDGRPRRDEAVIEQDGTVRTFEISVSPLRLEDGETGVVSVVHNVTRIKSLERVRREFIGNVSHELRTPLTIINGYLETLLEGGLEDRSVAENALRVMFRHSERLKHLVDDLLVVSQADSRAVPLDVQPVEIRDLVRRVVAQFDQPIRAQCAEVRITTAAEDLVVEADPIRLEQVLFNLLGNALKYGPHSGLVVEFHAERLGDNLHLQVKDNGPGIPREDQEHIFERFYRVHKDRSRDTGGTGLGLAIVKNVVKAHGGEVSLQSTPGSGSTFHVVLPASQRPKVSVAA